MESTTLALLVLVPLLVWRIYSRLKRLGARQRSQVWRHRAAAVLFPLALAALGAASMADVLALSCLAAGALAGGWLGVWGLKRTRFESGDKGCFFTPDRHLGIVVAMLFVARLLYRGLELYINSRAELPAPAGEFMRSPLTQLTFGLLAGYYALYAWGLLRWRRSQPPVNGAQ